MLDSLPLYEPINSRVVAYQLTAENFYAVRDWCGGSTWTTRQEIRVPDPCETPIIASIGDWIVATFHNTYTVVPHDEFIRTYRKARL